MSIWEMLKNLTIGPLELIFELIFSYAYQFTNHLGLSIVVLSLVVNILVLPLYKRADELQAEERKKQESMDKWVRHIKKTFKGDEKMMMLQAYYREKHYNPIFVLKSSVSLLLQIPFFMAAYSFLSGLHVLQGASFGPIANLGVEDAMFHIGSFPVNVLPILMTLINIVAGMIYTKGHPLKQKLQLYGMALVFLVLLYRSPSGLVFYWTLNNVFSLVKNIVQKIIEAVKKKAESAAKNADVTAQNAGKKEKKERYFLDAKWENILFFLAATFLALFMGVYVPSAVISSSVAEFVDIFALRNPIWILLPELCYGIGLFVVWLGVFYLMSNRKLREVFLQIVLTLCVITAMNFMLFKVRNDSLNYILRYTNPPEFVKKTMIINLLAILPVGFLVHLLFRIKASVYKACVPAACAVIIILCGRNMTAIAKGYHRYDRVVSALNTEITLNLSREHKNVIVFMLDRSLGMYMPYILNERPDLKEKFDGFTYYRNTVSFGAYTNMGAPAVYGGYEYTPENMNKRDKEMLVDKNNECLKVMPVLFAENGYEVTITDPPYANYDWVPDVSIYDEYDNITAGVLEYEFNESGKLTGEISRELQNRNMFCYSFMVCSPQIVRSSLYNNGYYRKEKAFYDEREDLIEQSAESKVKAHGLKRTFMDWYAELENLPAITKVTEDSKPDGSDKAESDKGSFLMITNGLTHEPAILQEPNYEPQMDVDNTPYYTDVEKRFTVDGHYLRMDNIYQVFHYQTNMCALIKIGEWMDYLKEQGVYDNTRIIIVADHGRLTDQMDLFTNQGTSMELFLPLMMVKDFDAKGFTVSEEFMTNADTPSLALEGLIENPTNPFTGNPLDAHEKYEGDPIIFYSEEFSVVYNNGSKFLPGDWYTLHNGDPYDIKNWEYLGNW